MPHLELHLVEDPDQPASVEVYADGYVDGTPVRFLVDTGGATSTVPPGLGSPAASMRVSHGAGGGQIQAGSVRMDEVTCGVPLLRQAVWFLDPGRALWSVSAVG